jgi:hypothetical protein
METDREGKELISPGTAGTDSCTALKQRVLAEMYF